MDKKDDNKKPSKDKKKDKGKKDKKKKVVKKKSDDKISQSQIVNIKIGDISKPKTRTRRKAAPKAPPPPPQIQRQLQYLPSLVGQAPMIPPPLAPAPTPPPAPPRPPPPPPAPAPAPAAEPRRTGDFFSDDTSGLGSRFGTSYDLASAPEELELLGALSRSSSRPTLSQSLRSRSGSEMSSLTDVDFGEAASSGSFQQFGGNIDLNDLDSVKFGDDVTPPVRILRRRVDEMSVVDNLTEFDMKEQRRKLRLNNITQSTQAESEEVEGIIGRVQATGDDDSIESYLMFDPRFQVTRTTLSTQPEEELGVGADFENIAAPSVVNVADNLGFVSSQQPQEIQELQPTQTPPEAQPIEAQLVEQLPIAVPVTEDDEDDPRISETLQEQAVVKGDVKPEDEATGGGGVPPFNFTAAMRDPVQQDLIFKRFTLERALGSKNLDGGVKSVAAAIKKYNLINNAGNPLADQTFGDRYNQWLGKPGRQAEINKLSIEDLIAQVKEAKEKAKQVSGAAAAESPKEEAKQVSGAAAESPKKEAKKQGSGAAAESPVKKGGKQVSKKAGKK